MSVNILKAFKSRTWLAALFLGCVLFASAALHAEDQPWRPRVNKNGIEVSTRPVDGSATLEFKGRMTVDAPLDQVTAIFEDVRKMTSWFYECTAADTLEQTNDAQKTVHMVLHMPWPVADRDCVFQITRSTEIGTNALRYAAVAIPDKIPDEPGKIRVPYLKGYWRFMPLSDQKTEVYFQQHSEPGGSIPAFVANSLVVNMPYHSLKNLRALVYEKK